MCYQGVLLRVKEVNQNPPFRSVNLDVDNLLLNAIHYIQAFQNNAFLLIFQPNFERTSKKIKSISGFWCS